MITLYRRREGERYEEGLNWQVFNGRNIAFFRLVWFTRSGAIWLKTGVVLQFWKRWYWLPTLSIHHTAGIL